MSPACSTATTNSRSLTIALDVTWNQIFTHTIERDFPSKQSGMRYVALSTLLFNPYSLSGVNTNHSPESHSTGALRTVSTKTESDHARGRLPLSMCHRSAMFLGERTRNTPLQRRMTPLDGVACRMGPPCQTDSLHCFTTPALCLSFPIQRLVRRVEMVIRLPKSTAALGPWLRGGESISETLGRRPPRSLSKVRLVWRPLPMNTLFIRTRCLWQAP